MKYLFENIKNGDHLAFYHKPWYYLFSKLIFWVTRKKMDHVACIFDVKIKKGTLTFKVGELVTKEKKITEYLIVNGINGVLIDSRFRNNDIDNFYLPLDRKITKKQNNILFKYWSTPEDYKITQLPFTVNWIYKLLGDKKKVYDRNCSTACRRALELAGIVSDKDDKAPNPKEFSEFSFIKEIIKL